MSYLTLLIPLLIRNFIPVSPFYTNFLVETKDFSNTEVSNSIAPFYFFSSFFTVFFCKEILHALGLKFSSVLVSFIYFINMIIFLNIRKRQLSTARLVYFLSGFVSTFDVVLRFYIGETNTKVRQTDMKHVLVGFYRALFGALSSMIGQEIVNRTGHYEINIHLSIISQFVSLCFNIYDRIVDAEKPRFLDTEITKALWGMNLTMFCAFCAGCISDCFNLYTKLFINNIFRDTHVVDKNKSAAKLAEGEYKEKNDVDEVRIVTLSIKLPDKSESKLKEELIKDSNPNEELTKDSSLKEEDVNKSNLKEELINKSKTKEELTKDSSLKEEDVDKSSLKEELINESKTKEELTKDSSLKEQSINESSMDNRINTPNNNLETDKTESKTLHSSNLSSMLFTYLNAPIVFLSSLLSNSVIFFLPKYKIPGLAQRRYLNGNADAITNVLCYLLTLLIVCYTPTNNKEQIYIAALILSSCSLLLMSRTKNKLILYFMFLCTGVFSKTCNSTTKGFLKTGEIGNSLIIGCYIAESILHTTVNQVCKVLGVRTIEKTRVYAYIGIAVFIMIALIKSLV